MRISTQAARGFACVHVLLSVAMVGALISDIESVRAERLIAFKELRLLRRKLDADLIRSLDKDGDGVDKVEFVVGMLTALELVTWEDAEPFMKQFESLDQVAMSGLSEHVIYTVGQPICLPTGQTAIITPATF